jgi:hypothetical protein
MVVIGVIELNAGMVVYKKTGYDRILKRLRTLRNINVN